MTGWDRATTKFRDRTVLLLRARWHWITLATLVSHLSLFLVLLLALRFVGVTADQVSLAEALAVFAFARLLTAIPFTPGGLGVIELALITGLSAAGGPRALVAAAVLIFRALTYVLPIPIGAGAPTSSGGATGRGGGSRTPRRGPSWCRSRCEDAGAARPARSTAAGPTSPWWWSAAASCVLAALPVDAGQVPDAEAAVFRVLNGTTVLPFVVVWPVMQLGNVLVVPASRARRRRVPPVAAGGGAAGRRPATYVAAKVVKGIWPRGRPDDAARRRGRSAAPPRSAAASSPGTRRP